MRRPAVLLALATVVAAAGLTACQSPAPTDPASPASSARRPCPLPPWRVPPAGANAHPTACEDSAAADPARRR